MSRFRIATFVVAGLAALALCAVSAGAASAETFTLNEELCNGTIWNLCYVNSKSEILELVGKQTFTVEKKSGSAKGIFKGIISGEEFTIECEAVSQGSGTNVITQSAPLTTSGIITGRLKFSKCALTAPAALAAKCVIPAEKETLALTGTLTSEKELKLVPESGGETGPFIELEFKNNETVKKETCPSTFKTGLHAVTGFQVVEVINPATGEETKSGKAIVKSGLKLAGSPAELSGELTLSFTGLSDNVVVALA